MKTFKAEVTLSSDQITGIFGMFVDQGFCTGQEDPVAALSTFINRETDLIAKTLSERMTAYRVSKLTAATPPITTTVTVVETEPEPEPSA